MKKLGMFVILGMSLIFTSGSYAEDIGFFDDFGPADIIVVSESTLRLRSGSVIDLQKGSKWVVDGRQVKASADELNSIRDLLASVYILEKKVNSLQANNAKLTQKVEQIEQLLEEVDKIEIPKTKEKK